MMVEVRIENGEIESEDYYEVNIPASIDDGTEHECDADTEEILAGYETVHPVDSRQKYDMIKKRWESLYDQSNAVCLQDAVKKHLYTKEFGDDRTLDMETMSEDFDPLNF